MNNDIITHLIIGGIIGFIIGIILISTISPKARRYNKVKRELDEAQEALNTQKQIIVKHFSHSAEILDNMAKDFRRLYQHMAENSSQLVNSEEIALPAKKAEAKNNTNTTSAPTGKQPKDYSTNASGLLKTEEKKS